MGDYSKRSGLTSLTVSMMISIPGLFVLDANGWTVPGCDSSDGATLRRLESETNKLSVRLTLDDPGTDKNGMTYSWRRDA
jgi:hypothetical protein